LFPKRRGSGKGEDRNSGVTGEVPGLRVIQENSGLKKMEGKKIGRIGNETR
jgi:hypothetical protein